MKRIERMQDVVEKLVATITGENNAVPEPRLLKTLNTDNAQDSSPDCAEAMTAFLKMKANLLTEMRNFCQITAGLVSARDPAAAGEFAMHDEHIDIQLQKLRAEAGPEESIPD